MAGGVQVPLSGCVFESNGLVPVPVVRGAVHGPVVPRIPIPLSIGKGTHFLVVGERGGEEVAVEELLCLEVLQTDHTPTLDWSPSFTVHPVLPLDQPVAVDVVSITNTCYRLLSTATAIVDFM